MPLNWKSEWRPLAAMVAVFLAAFYLPAGSPRFDGAVAEALHLVKWYAREHVLLCLIPAFFIAGAISVFISSEAVIRLLGDSARRWISYSVASVSGAILAVCSCTVLPLFGGIYKRGAGLGPAIAFLYAGPAINILAIILTARILGFELGVARAVGAVAFSVVIGGVMALLFTDRSKAERPVPTSTGARSRPLWQPVWHMGFLIAILVFANWAQPQGAVGLWAGVYSIKWWLTGMAALGLAWAMHRWFGLRMMGLAAAAAPVLVLATLFPDVPLLAFAAGAIGLSILTAGNRGETGEWFASTWDFARQILPLLLLGVLVAGLLLGRPGQEGLIPSAWIANSVGGNSIGANFFAAFAGAFMYFATLTEIPIVQGLLGSGMGKGPALALLLAGPALSLPNMLVINSIMGPKRTAAFVTLVIVMSTVSGLFYGSLF
ncbi:MAG: permease [Candidatus Zixiibacteriota bacterium]